MEDKILSLLGLARRAGRLAAGFEAAAQAAREGKAAAVISAGDISPKTYKNLEYEARRAGIPAARLRASMKELSRACGIKAGVFAVTDQGFAQAILDKMGSRKDEKEEHGL